MDITPVRICVPRQQVRRVLTPSIRDLEARVAFEIFHEMVQRRPLRSAGRCTEASQLGYCICDIDSYPCCRELELCNKRPIVLLFASIRQHRYICRIENNTRRDRHLLGAQHLLDVLLVIRQNLLDITVKMKLDCLSALFDFHSQKCLHQASSSDLKVF